MSTRKDSWHGSAVIAALVAMLVAAGCDQGDGGPGPTDVATEDSTGFDVETDGPEPDAEEDPAEDTVVPDADDPVEETPLVIPDPGTYRDSMTVNGVTRTYTLVVPETAVASMASGRVPFLIGLHGAGDTGSNFITATRLTDLASANAFVVVGPDGFNRGWFVQGSEGWTGADGYTSSVQNDIEYMMELIDLGYESYGIDMNRIYVTGHSRGAGMTGILAFGSGQITTAAGLYTSPFAAYCVNAGYDAYGGSMSLTLSSPKRPVWVIHGTADTVVPFSYGEDFANSLTAAGWDVTWTPVTGAGHTWLFQSSLGQTNQDMWNFFADNPLP